MEQERKHSFNAIDFLLLFLVFAGVLTLVLRGGLSRTLGLEDVGSPHEITLLVEEIDKEKLAALTVNAAVKHPTSGEELGTLISVLPRTHLVYSIKDDGGVTVLGDKETSDVTLVFEGIGKKTKHGFLINATENFTPGMTLSLTVGETVFEATVLETKEITPSL